MTIKVSPPLASEASLLRDSATLSASPYSFQQRLEEEQKRLGFLFSPFTNFNFSAWFTSPVSLSKNNNQVEKVPVFSDIDLSALTTSPRGDTPSSGNMAQASTIENFKNSGMPVLGQNPKNFLQELFLKNDWLVPNLSALPTFAQAQMAGQLLNKFDMQSLVDKILNQVELLKTQGKVELRMGLKPENLGEIILTLTSQGGLISVQIQAQEEGRKLLQEKVNDLTATLKKANINLAEIKVSAMKEVKEHAD